MTIGTHRDPTTIWRPVEGFVCRMCGSPARRAANDPDLWSCATCRFTTRSVYFNFKGTKQRG